MEILGNNLKNFFDKIDNPSNEAEITYAGSEYEVWIVTKELFDKMCNMSENDFTELAGEDAWWRHCDGSNLGLYEIGTIKCNGREMIGWIESPLKKGIHFELFYTSLTEYLCEFIGASTCKNVCACAIDLARYNNMTMGELFEKYEGE